MKETHWAIGKAEYSDKVGPRLSVVAEDFELLLSGPDARVMAAMLLAAADAMDKQLVCSQPFKDKEDPAWYR